MKATLQDALSGLFRKTGTARVSHNEQVARNAVMRSINRAGMSLTDIHAAIDRYGDKPAVLAEVIGQDAVNALTALTRKPGTTSNKAQGIIAERAGGFVDRARTDLEQLTGIDPDDVPRLLNDLAEDARSEAAPFYDEAFRQFHNIDSPKLQQLAQTPKMKRHLKNADDEIATRAAIRGIPVEQMSNLDRWDVAKRSLDDAIGRAVAQKDKQTLRILTELKTDVVKELDRLSTRTLVDGSQSSLYQAAREAGERAPKLEAAEAAGRKAIKSSAVKARDIRDQVNEMGVGSDRGMFQAGVVSEIADRFDKNLLKPQRFRVRDNQAKVRAGLGSDAGQKLVNRMEAEAELADMGQRWAPRSSSVTGTVLEGGESHLEGIARTGERVARRDWIGLIADSLRGVRRQGFNEKQLDAMGDILLSNPTDGLKRLGLTIPPGGPPAPRDISDLSIGELQQIIRNRTGRTMQIDPRKVNQPREMYEREVQDIIGGRKVSAADFNAPRPEPLASGSQTTTPAQYPEPANNGARGAITIDAYEDEIGNVMRDFPALRHDSVGTHQQAIRNLLGKGHTHAYDPELSADVMRALDNGVDPKTAIDPNWRPGADPAGQSGLDDITTERTKGSRLFDLNSWKPKNEDGFSAQSVLPPVVGASGGFTFAPDMDGDGKVTSGERIVGAVGGAGTGVVVPRLIPPTRSGGRLGSDIVPLPDGASAGFFGGRKAKGANKARLKEAKQAARSGSADAQILDETGWFRGADGKWRHEIEGTGATLKDSGFWKDGGTRNLEEVFDHPGLYEAYPFLRTKKVSVKDMKGTSHGSYDPIWGEITINRARPADQFETLVHEIQHAIQAKERFAKGTAPLFSHDRYYRSMGETEARNVQHRASNAERREMAPWLTEDESRNRQLHGGLRDGVPSFVGQVGGAGSGFVYAPDLNDDGNVDLRERFLAAGAGWAGGRYAGNSVRRRAYKPRTVASGASRVLKSPPGGPPKPPSVSAIIDETAKVRAQNPNLSLAEARSQAQVRLTNKSAKPSVWKEHKGIYNNGSMISKSLSTGDVVNVHLTPSGDVGFDLNGALQADFAKGKAMSIPQVKEVFETALDGATQVIRKGRPAEITWTSLPSRSGSRDRLYNKYLGEKLSRLGYEEIEEGIWRIRNPVRRSVANLKTDIKRRLTDEDFVDGVKYNLDNLIKRLKYFTEDMVLDYGPQTAGGALGLSAAAIANEKLNEQRRPRQLVPPGGAPQ
ncbi:MAG: LPD23 domain-containing protein [Pseudomonadota bacterium]